MKKLFIKLNLFDIDWSPYNGGASYSFNISLLGIGGIFVRHLFYFRIEQFYQWNKPKFFLELFFIKILKPKNLN